MMVQNRKNRIKPRKGKKEASIRALFYGKLTLVLHNKNGNLILFPELYLCRRKYKPHGIAAPSPNSIREVKVMLHL